VSSGALHRVFELFDSDQSGTLTHDEATELIELMYPGMPPVDKGEALEMIADKDASFVAMEKIILRWREMARLRDRAQTWHHKRRSTKAVRVNVDDEISAVATAFSRRSGTRNAPPNSIADGPASSVA